MVSYPNIDILYYYHNIVSYLVAHSPGYFVFAKSVVGVIVGLSVPLSLMLLIGIIFCVEATKHIRNKEDKIYNPEKVVPAYVDVSGAAESDMDMANQWKKIMEHMDSDNQNDWKQAILSADAMLEDLLVKLGYRGEGIGERLRRVEKGDFKTLDQAGEAHGVRNRIAHDGSNFELNKVEAQRVIGLYRQVFEEFYHIS